jgi:hypothetical protein
MPPKLTLYSWLLVPVAVLAYSFGPAQASSQRVEAARRLALTARSVQQEEAKGAMHADNPRSTSLPKLCGSCRNDTEQCRAAGIRETSGEDFSPTP